MYSFKKNSFFWLLGLVLLWYTASALPLSAQVLQPSKVTYSLSDKDYQVGDTLTLNFHVSIDEGWYMYSSDFDPDLGPILTTFEFTPHDSYELIGGIEAIGAKRKYDDLWGGEYTYFRHKALYQQRIVVKKATMPLEGFCEYQVCTDAGKCILQDASFTWEDFTGEPADSSDTTTTNQTNQTVAGNTGSGSTGQSADSSDTTDTTSLWQFFLLSFLGGLAALFTPCVFPLIPMTVSYFTKKAEKGSSSRGHSVFYGVSIVLIYALIGLVVAPFMGAEVANELATGWIPNLLFFLLLVVFGLSFLGMFEITLPHKWTNFSESQSDKKGLLGVFFMSLTLVLVTFSCTGPIVGSILVQAAGGEIITPVVGMLGYSLAFAFPFTFFSVFPKWLTSLPKSGSWMNTVKVILGFLELALSLKFLSVADQVYHWNLLDREVYLALWIVIFSSLGFYLLGKLKLPKDSPLESVPVSRLLLAIAVFSFVVYLVPGMFGAPLKALAGYLPPSTTLDFNLNASHAQPNTSLSGQSSAAQSSAAPLSGQSSLCDAPRYADILHFPHGLQGYFLYKEALQCAKEQNKPVFIDFTGHGCVNCREMEARVWADPQVLKRLQENFVLLALYVDERTTLPEAEWYVSSNDNKQKKTLGKQNADLQITSYQNNAQPYYVIIDAEEQLLTAPQAYNLEVQNFIDFLDEAYEKFQNNSLN